jgi:DUF1365 family protein
VSYWLVDLDELGELDRRFALVSYNRPNVVSFRDGDHFEGGALKASVVAFAGDGSIDRVLMLTQPRVFGYVFNPVTFYWCYRGEELRCMVAELNNTYGDRLPEVLAGPSLRYEHRKRLHVSPFFDLDYTYRYSFTDPADRVWARIEVRGDDGSLPLQAVLQGRREELSTGAILRSLACRPLMPLRITALIHWQAFRLWLKRVPFHRRPPFVPGAGSVR